MVNLCSVHPEIKPFDGQYRCGDSWKIEEFHKGVFNTAILLPSFDTRFRSHIWNVITTGNDSTCESRYCNNFILEEHGVIKLSTLIWVLAHVKCFPKFFFFLIIFTNFKSVSCNRKKWSLCYRPNICIIPLKATWELLYHWKPKCFAFGNLTSTKALDSRAFSAQLALCARCLVRKQYKTESLTKNKKV